MITAVQKWGNSLALRIPKAYAKETDICDGTSVDLSLQAGSLVIKPVVKMAISLDDLLRDVTVYNRHEATDTGSPVGQEIW